jgi:hypothetical protein
MEVIKTMGGVLQYDHARHRYSFNGERVKLTVSGICGSGYPLAFGIPSNWSAKLCREELIRVVLSGADLSPADVAVQAKEICKAPSRFSLRAAEIGTRVHAHVENLALGLEPVVDDDEEVARCQRGVEEWYRENIREPHHVERRMYSARLKIAGTTDMIATLKDGRTVLLDWKGVTDFKRLEIKPANIGQLSAYRSMAEEAGEKIHATVLVRFSRETGEVKATVFDETYEEDLAIFENVLATMRYKPEGQAL